MKLMLVGMAICLLFLLFGCGGGGGGSTPSVQTPTNPNPPPAPTPTCGEDEVLRNGECEHQNLHFLTATGARYAHSQNYRGQGVIVSSSPEGVRATHRDLSPNIITLTNFPNKFDDDDSHGTGVAGIIARVAPAAKMVFPYLTFDTAHRITTFSINIRSVSLGTNELSDLPFTATLSQITTHATIIARAERVASIYVASDIIYVRGIGNNGFNSVQNTINSPLYYAAYPYIEPDLEDNWLIATAVDRNTVIAEYRFGEGANGCGYAAMWCIAAFGGRVSIYTTGSESDTDYNPYYGGTSAATPQVAGALAVLKSAADDLFSGKPNLEGMRAMTTVRLILLETATDLTPDDGQRVDEIYGWGLVNISAGIKEIQGIAGQVQAIEQMAKVRLGSAAKFAAANKFSPAKNNAFRFWGGLENAQQWTGIATQEYGGVSGFAEYGNSDLRINSFLANGEIRGVESENWTAGFRYADILRHNDNLQISARQESPINSGDLVLHYSFGKQIRIPIKQKPATIWTAAYSQKTDNGEWTAAAEWNERTNDTGFSFAAEIGF